MKRNGTTSAGRTRWRCPSPECGVSRTLQYQRDGSDLTVFLDWLFSKRTQAETGANPRTFRRRTRWCWELWPPVPLVDEIHHVVHVDGIHLHRQAVVLIAIADSHVIGWHVTRRETSAGWMNLMARIAPSDVVVCDGGGGLLKACAYRVAGYAHAALPVPRVHEHQRAHRHAPAPGGRQTLKATGHRVESCHIPRNRC